MLLPGSRSLASSLPLLLLKTDIQTRRKEQERVAGAPGPLPACSQGWPPGDCDPDPSASTLHFTQGAELRNRLQIYCGFFSRSIRHGQPSIVVAGTPGGGTRAADPPSPLLLPGGRREGTGGSPFYPAPGGVARGRRTRRQKCKGDCVESARKNRRADVPIGNVGWTRGLHIPVPLGNLAAWPGCLYVQGQ